MRGGPFTFGKGQLHFPFPCTIIGITWRYVQKGETLLEPYRLAICEDDPRERQSLESLCREILQKRGIPGEVASYPSTEALDSSLQEGRGPFDLLLLDIQMAGINGMEFAKTLRDRGDEVRILFITGAAEYALEGYQVNPIHYLLKPVNQQELERVLVGDWERNHRSKTLLFRQGTKWVALAVYIERLNRNVVVHTDKAQHTFSMTLTEVEAMVPGGGFAKCHNSFLVNFRRVEEIGRTSLRLRSGEELPMGRRFYRDFQTAFVRFINQ